MGSVVLTGASSGATTITPTDGVTATVTLPSTGGTLQTSGAGFTTNGVAYASSTSALTTGSALTFDGTNLILGSANPNFQGSSSTGSATLINNSGGAYVRVYGGSHATKANFTEFVNASSTSTFDSAGNLGLGVTPSAWTAYTTLQIGNGSVANYSGSGDFNLLSNAYFNSGVFKYITSSIKSSRIQIANGGFGFQISTDGTQTAGNAITFTQAMTLTTSKSLLVNTTNNSVTGDSTGAGATFVNASSGYPGFVSYATTSTAATGIAAFWSDNHGTPSVAAYFRADGGLANYSANNSNLSDENLKKDIVLSGNYLEKICAIPVKNFRYKSQDESEDITLGVIAQDVEKVAPELVCKEGFGASNEKQNYLSIYQTDLQYALMKSIQELSTLITAQQSTIQSLTERITALEGART